MSGEPPAVNDTGIGMAHSRAVCKLYAKANPSLEAEQRIRNYDPTAYCLNSQPIRSPLSRLGCSANHNICRSAPISRTRCHALAPVASIIVGGLVSERCHGTSPSRHSVALNALQD